MTEPVAEEFYGLLVPLADERLIVPRSCVAEVVAWQEPAPMAGAPSWYVGTVTWSNREVPVISFEGTLGRAIPEASGRTRIVVLHCLGTRLAVGAFGILTQGFPQLVRLNPDVVKPDPTRSFPERSPVLCGLRMVNEAPLVPDLEYLEALIAEETSVAA
ncbi:MAG TPA: chemotaxis protein CheW [Steroidobacteraceae bacterium]|nr:chemotaxis protein CheW [Steroidobacteraceae bacterium]